MVQPIQIVDHITDILHNMVRLPHISHRRILLRREEGMYLNRCTEMQALRADYIT